MPLTSEHEHDAWPEQLRDWWIDRVLRHRWWVLGLALVLTTISVVLAARLEIDPDLRALLPRSNPVTTAIDHVERNFGVIGSINVLVEGGDPEARHAFADALAEELADDPMLRAVDHRLGSEFFVEHALYYLPEADMDELEELVAAWQHYELCSAAPDICVAEPDPEAPAKLQTFVDRKRAEIDERSSFSDYYEREGIEALVVFLRPTESSANVDFSVAVVAHISERVEEVFARDGPWHATDMHYNLTGPYVVKAAEKEIISRDTLRSGVVALIGVVFVIYLLFRSTRAVLTLLVPLACGIAWSLAATQLTLGHLNAVTSMISSMLMGLGIDAGIHFLTLARRERERHETNEAIRRAFRDVIAPLLVASTTTASAFVIMATSEFLGFREFGIIAAIGVALCLLAMTTVYPALLAVTGIKRVEIRASGTISQTTRLLMARPGLVFAGVVVLTVLSAKGVDTMWRDGFERNGRLLQSDRTRADVEDDTFLISEILGHDVHGSVLAVDDYAELERIYEMARSRHAKRAELGETLIADLIAAPMLMPPKEIDQTERHRRIAALTEDWSERTWSRLEGIDPAQLPPEPAPGKVVDDDWDDGGEAGDDEWGEFQPYQGDGDSAGGSSESGTSETGGGTETGTGSESETESEGDSETAETGDEPQPEAPPQADPPSEPAAKPAGLRPEDGKLLRSMLEAKPFGPEDLPPQILTRLRGDDGSWGIFAHPNYDSADIYTGISFMAETETYADGEGVYVGEPTVYATMYVLMNEEWPVIIGMSTLLIGFLVFWQVRTLTLTLITMAPLMLAFWWMFGILGTFEIKFNLFNVPILPAILGIGIDNGVYLIAAIRRESSSKTGLYRSVDETGGAILAATMTTVAGFGAFLVADNGGLRSIGQIAAIGVLMASLAAVLAVPSISALVQRRRDRLNGD
jgi:predicted RND superfamily exporter protein